MMEPQDLASSELRAIKKQLCYISCTACALCLVCTATTLVLVLSNQTQSSKEQTRKEHQTQTQGNGTQIYRPYPIHSTDYARLKWDTYTRNISRTLLWESKHKHSIHGIKYNNGNLTISTDGLYFIHCHLHFYINEYLKKNEDLVTELNVNGRVEHMVMHSVLNSSQPILIYRDQYLSLHIDLKVADNVSITTSHALWLNSNTDAIARSNVFEALKL
ncbi:tumor necrosis factor ligand superfamily member 8 [Hyperolius riggenbachi]|uniref:tumor necrosis factor ligand superfamily member 8 n=1 Tax=Hyperolius riggenbachi TaxID=752182 RepID=UPI0035A3C432